MAVQCVSLTHWWCRMACAIAIRHIVRRRAGWACQWGFNRWRTVANSVLSTNDIALTRYMAGKLESVCILLPVHTTKCLGRY